MVGIVIWVNIWREVAPSISAASKSDVSTPIMAAIRRMVVFPNHIMKFINATSPRVPHTLAKKRIGSFVIPSAARISLMGPFSENKVNELPKLTYDAPKQTTKDYVILPPNSSRANNYIQDGKKGLCSYGIFLWTRTSI